MRRKTSNTKKKHIFLKAFAGLCCIFFIFAASLLLLITHQWQEAYEEYEVNNHNITPYGKTLVSAHRSGGGIFPENTMMAFEGCINSESFKTDVFEFDLHITSDEELIILHDGTLDRTTNAVEYFGKEEIRPENYTYHELRELNFGEAFKTKDGDKPYEGLRGDEIPESLRVANLKDVLDYLESSGNFEYIIEIKNGGELGCRAADRLYEILVQRDMLNKVVVGTFNNNVTEYLDEKYPEFPRSASIAEVVGIYFNSLLGIDKSPEKYKFSALQIPMGAWIIDLATTRFVNYAHRHNIAVQYWTINNTEDMELLREIGADCIMSDIPDVAYEILNKE